MVNVEAAEPMRLYPVSVLAEFQLCYVICIIRGF